MTYEDIERGAATLRKMLHGLDTDLPLTPIESTPGDGGTLYQEWTDAQRAALPAESADELGVPDWEPKGERPF